MGTSSGAGRRRNDRERPVGFEELFATCAGGLEPVLTEEIERLGLSVRAQEAGGVRFAPASSPDGSDIRTAVATANRRLRTASRVLLPVARGAVSDAKTLYALVQSCRWSRLIPSEATIAVSAVTRDARLADSRHVALTVKDAVVDAQRAGHGRRSNVDRRNPDIPIAVHIANGIAEISLDTTGRPLHERGYRTAAGIAPLRETLASGLVLASGWDATVPLVDPFCGSGTIAIEAALIAAGIGPGTLGRRFAYERWPRETLTRRPRVHAPRETADSVAHSRPSIIASDIDPAIAQVARMNAERAGVADRIEFVVADARELVPPETAGVIVTNPPYGKRLVDGEALGENEIGDLYEDLGEQLKAGWTGWSAWILSANTAALKRIRLRPASKTPLYNGALECRLYEYRLY